MKPQTINLDVLEDIKYKKPLLNRLTNWLPQPLRVIVQLLLMLAIILVSVTVPVLACFGIAKVFAVQPALGLFLVLSLSITFSILISKQQAKAKRKKKIYLDFAESNGWKFGKAGSLITNFNDGRFTHTTRLKNVTFYSIAGTYKGHDFELLAGWKGEGQSDLQLLSPELFVRTKKELPSLVLATRTSTSKVADAFFADFTKMKPVYLEGNFNQQYQLYVPEGKHIDAMALVAPDVMHTLTTVKGLVSIEMSGDTFVLRPAYLEGLNKRTATQIFRATEKILSETDY